MQFANMRLASFENHFPMRAQIHFVTLMLELRLQLLRFQKKLQRLSQAMRHVCSCELQNLREDLIDPTIVNYDGARR